MKSTKPGGQGRGGMSLRFSSPCNRIRPCTAGGAGQRLSGSQGPCWGFRITARGCNRTPSKDIYPVNHLDQPSFIQTEERFCCSLCPFRLHQYRAFPAFSFGSQKVHLALCRHLVPMDVHTNPGPGRIGHGGSQSPCEHLQFKGEV